MRKIGRFFNTFIYALSFIVLVVTFAIALPILWRDFYYFHIDLLNITEATGKSKSDLIFSFNELMDLWKENDISSYRQWIHDKSMSERRIMKAFPALMNHQRKEEKQDGKK